MVVPAEGVLDPPEGAAGLDYSRDFDGDLVMDDPEAPPRASSFTAFNRKPGSRPPPHFPVSKHDDAVIGELEHNWTIDDWSTIATSKTNRQYSEPFFVPIHHRGYPNDGWWFRVLLMPKGYDKSERYVSLYLALDEDKNRMRLSEGEWSLCVDFLFTVVNPETDACLTKYVHHRFDADTLDWGFSQFLWTDPGEEESVCRYVSASSNQVCVNVRVRIIDDPTGMLWVSPASVAYDSKRATGCVGLQNQGATCYMNSILQSLFLTNSFRKSVYSIPTEDKQPHDSIPLALQRLFYALTFSSHPPNTNDLTASFGWDLHESFTQHDVQEFLRVLMDDLEEKFKQTSADGTIDKMFGGRVKRVIRCLNVAFESSRSETVYDVQMPVSGCPTLKDSFDSYIARETMTGDNKYMAEGHGLQDAEMFNVFDRLPPVLHLILMRYRYDPHKDSTVKINDRFEFPEEIDLRPYMSDASDQQSVPQDYVLHSVLVHSGDGHGGHYTAFIRPDPVKKPLFWLKFDDTRVTEVSKEEAMDDNFGGGGGSGQSMADLDTDSPAATRSKTALAPKPGSRDAKLAYYKRVTSAYMLVYVRKADAPTVLCPFTLHDIPTHIIKQIEEEVAAEEARHQEHLLQMTTVKLSVYTPDCIKGHPGYDLFCSDPHPACPLTPFHVLRLKKELPVSAVMDALKAVDAAFDGGRGRLWTFAQRRNRTIRLDDVVYDSSLSEPADVVTLGLLHDKIGAMGSSLQLYADTIVPGLETGCQTNQKSTIYVFFKLFDPVGNLLRPLHGLLVDKSESLRSYEQFIRHMVHTTAPLEYYEEVKVGRVDKIHHPDRSFVECELKSGDVVVVVPTGTTPQPACSLLEYYHDLQTLLKVTFVSVEKEREREKEGGRGRGFEAVVSTKCTLRDLLGLIGDKTGWSADSIRPVPVADPLYSALPRPAINKPVGIADLQSPWVSVLLPSAAAPSMSATVFYELLPIPLHEMLKRKLVKVRDCCGAEASVWVEKTAPVSTLSLHGTDLLKSAEPGVLHFYEMSTHKIIRELDPHHCFSDLLSDDIFVDRFPEPDPATELYIPGYMHHRDVSWGSPFVFKLVVGEPYGGMRKRLAAKLGIANDREVVKLNIQLSRYGRPQRSEQTEDTVLLPEMRELQSHEQLAVEHADRPKTPLDGSVKIKRSAPASE